MQRAPKSSRWLWLAMILDAPIVLFRSWNAVSVWMASDFGRLPLGWTRLDLALLAAFFCGGLVSIVIAVVGTRGPLFFWNLCYLAILMQVIFSTPLYNISPSIFVFIGTLTIAEIAIYLAHRQMTDGAGRFHVAISN